MSSPSEPEDTVSISIERSFLPSFITEPLPNCRSIWESAADRALVLSMEDPSTIRRAVADIVGAPYGGDSRAGQTARSLEFGVLESCTTFVPCSQYVLFCPLASQSGFANVLVLDRGENGHAGTRGFRDLCDALPDRWRGNSVPDE